MNFYISNCFDSVIFGAYGLLKLRRSYVMGSSSMWSNTVEIFVLMDFSTIDDRTVLTDFFTPGLLYS